MPARKMVTLKVSPSKLRTLTFNAEFVEFAKRSLEETFLAYVDQVTDKNPSHASSSAGSSFSSVGNSTTGTVAASPQHGNAHSEDDEDEEYNAIEHATSRWTSTQPSSSSENEPKQSFAHRSRTIPSFASSSEDADMPENNNNTTTNQQPAAGAESGGGQPFYEEQRKKLQKLLERRILAKKKLDDLEILIESKETAYLDSTPAGNIMTGFDNYTKGTTQAAAAQRRKTGPLDQHRVFSRSSISYNPNAVSDTATTPGSSHAPTPVSSSFGLGSNHPTPTSAGGSRSAGAGSASGGQKDRKKKGVTSAGGADGGDSESDAKEMKKVRTNFGAARK